MERCVIVSKDPSSGADTLVRDDNPFYNIHLN